MNLLLKIAITPFILRHVIRVYIKPIHSKQMNEALNEAVHERFRFIEGRLYWLQFIRFFRGPFNVQMLHIPALNLNSNDVLTMLLLKAERALHPRGGEIDRTGAERGFTGRSRGGRRRRIGRVCDDDSGSSATRAAL